MCFHFELEYFFHAFDNCIWPTISSPLIFQQNSYISTERQKNIFAYLQLTNFVVWTHDNDQLRRIITLETIMIWKYPWNFIGYFACKTAYIIQTWMDKIMLS